MISLLMAASLGLAALQPAPRCDGFEIDITQTDGLVYDGADITDTIIHLSLRATETELSSRCGQVTVSLAITNGSAAEPRLSGAAAELEADWERSDDIRLTGSTWRLQRNAVRRLVSGETLTLPFYRLAAGQFIPPGLYEHRLEIASGDRLATTPIASQVLPALRFEGNTSAGTHAIDLGDIDTGARGRSDFFFRTNTAVSVMIRSDNLGALIHERGEEFGAVRYTASVSGQRVDLSLPGGDTVDFPYRSSAVQSGSLEVDVPPATHHYAGRYRDVITMSFIPY